MAENKEARKIISENRKAYHEYFVLEKHEAGIELFGTEVKSVRLGKVNFKDCYADIDSGELLFSECTFHPTKKEISSTRTRFVRKSF